MENSNIGWCHHTQNYWLGCDKIAPECAHCYIERILRLQGREPWGQLYRTQTWKNPLKWQREAESQGVCHRVFTNSLSDFFHKEADAWRAEAWDIIKRTPNLVWLILTKRPERIEKRLPSDWGQGYPNVWLGVSSGCKKTLNKLDSLRRIPVHPQAVRFVSAEPLLEDISEEIDLGGFGWLIVGGESGGGPEYLWDSTKDWRDEFNILGRRTMNLEWARNLLDRARAAGIPYFFKQVTAFHSGQGEDALGRPYQEFPHPPMAVWAKKLSKKANTVNEKPDVLDIPDFLPQRKADELFARIKAEADFRQNYIKLFGSKPIPRLEAWYSPWEYPYSNGIVLKPAPMPAYLQTIIERLKACGFGDYNAVLINLYRDGEDYSGWHSDADFGTAEPTIASITLGAARPFRLRRKADKSRVVEYLPVHGSLLIMQGRTNLEWEHMVPKTSKAIGERINLTFRFKALPPEDHSSRTCCVPVSESAQTAKEAANPIAATGQSTADCASSGAKSELPEPSCSRCGDLHRRIIEVAKANPERDVIPAMPAENIAASSTQNVTNPAPAAAEQPAPSTGDTAGGGCNGYVNGVFVEGEPIPLAKLADRLMGIADELRCAWGLDGFAEQIDSIAEEVERREELDKRMQVADERLRKSPCGISVQYTLKSMRRDRRFQDDMRLILKAGGTTYRGKQILGGDDPYTVRFSRKELMAEFKRDLQNQLGVTGTRDPLAEFYRTRPEPTEEEPLDEG